MYTDMKVSSCGSESLLRALGKPVAWKKIIVTLQQCGIDIHVLMLCHLLQRCLYNAQVCSICVVEQGQAGPRSMQHKLWVFNLRFTVTHSSSSQSFYKQIILMNGMRSCMIYCVCVCMQKKGKQIVLRNWSHTCRGYVLVTRGKQFTFIVGLL